MARVVNLLVAILVVSGCASELVLEQDGALAVIPHQTSRAGHIVVETTLNGQGPFRFALDTGATISVLYEKAQNRLEVDPIPGVQARVLGMTGTGDFPVATVDRISVGEETWRNARVALLPDTEPAARQLDGILGLDFLRQYAIWYSQEDRLLRLYPKELVAEGQYLGWSPLKLSELRVAYGDRSVLAFDIHIDGERIPAMFDLGSTVNLMNVKAARKLRIPTRPPANTVNVFGVIGWAPVLSEVRVWRLRIDNMQWKNRIFLVGEFPVFEVLAINRRPAAIVGTNFFAQRDFIIDFARERLLVRHR